MIKVGVIGHTGRLGKPLVEKLKKHPYAEIVYTHSTSEPSKITLLESKAELLFSALDKRISKEYEHEWQYIRVIDLSIDHRLDDEWVYGLPELNKDRIKGARKVANPGCYATAILLALLPIKDYLSDVEIKAYSGVSGRYGQEVIENGGIERYAQGREHQQVAEIEKWLGKRIEYFEPHIVYPIETGIVAKIEAQLNTDPSKIKSIYEESFKDKPFIKLTRFTSIKDLEANDLNLNLNYLKGTLEEVVNTNFCCISFNVDKDKIKIVSKLDNLIKGGSGQAVQNMNLMYGFDERTGLL